MVSQNLQIGKANGMLNLSTGPTHVGSLDAPRASHLVTFGPRRQGNALRGS